MAPTIVWSLHAFLTLVHKSRPSTSFIYQHLCALYETPGCTYRLIHVVEGLVCLNKCSVLWQHLSKNLQSLGRKKICPKLWNARTSNEVQHVENLNIDPDILIKFDIDLRDSWSQGPVRSFRRAHRRRKMRACMMLKSTETIAIEDAFPSRAALLLRRFFHNIRYNLCVWRRSWRWVRRCPATPSIMAEVVAD